MARERRVLNWCDMCQDQGERVPATFRNIRVMLSSPTRPEKMKTPGQLDLCERHYAETVRPLLEAIDYRRIRNEEPKRNRNRGRNVGPFKCQVPGCIATPLKHIGTLWQHVFGVHQITLDEYREKYGELVPMTEEELAALVVEARCEEDGCGQVYSTATGTRWPRQALVSHLRGRHGVTMEG